MGQKPSSLLKIWGTNSCLRHFLNKDYDSSKRKAPGAKGTNASVIHDKEYSNGGMVGPRMGRDENLRDVTNPLFGLAKRRLLDDGLIVPVDDAEEAEEAEDESSSWADSGSGLKLSCSSPSSPSSFSCSSNSSFGGSGGSKGRPANFAFAKDRWRSLMISRRLEGQRAWRMWWQIRHMRVLCGYSSKSTT